MQLHSLLTKVVLIALAITLAGCGGAEARKAKYLERAKSYLEQENYDKAAIELKNVLQIDPKHAEAYLLLGDLEEKRNNHRQAFGAYTKAVELAPDNTHAQAMLGRYYLLSGNTTKAAELAEGILAKAPNDVEGRVLRAALRVREGEEDKALSEAEAVLTDHPGNADAAELVSAIYQKRRKPEKAISTLTDSIAKNPKDVSMRQQLARLYAEQNTVDMAEQVLREIIQLEPGKMTHRATLAVFLARTEKLADAEKVLREAVQADPDDPQRTIVLAEFLANRRSVDQAKQELEKAIEANPATPLQFALAALYEVKGLSEKAVELYRAVISDQGTKPDGLQARNALANLLFKQEKYDAAGELAAEVLKENPRDNQALLLQSKVALEKGDALSAISSLRSVLKDQPESSAVLTLLGEAHQKNREPELAREHFHKAVAANPRNVAGRVRYAQYLASTGDRGEAAKEIDRALAIDDDDASALSTKAQIQASNKNLTGAESTLKTLKRAHPKNPIGYYLSGQLLVGQKKYDQAIQEFEQAIALAPTKPEALTALVSAHFASGHPERAEKRIENALKETPEAALLHNLLGEIYLRQKKYSEAERSLARARELQPGWNAPHNGLATLYTLQGNHSEAVAALETGLKSIPDDPMLLMALAHANERKGNFTASIDAYERVLKRNPNQLVAANNLAALLADHKSDADGLKRARELLPLLEESAEPALRDTAAWVYYRAGQADKAITLLKPVVEKLPQAAIFQYHLGMAYHKQGDAQAAKLHLSKAVAGNPNFPGVDEARATLSAIP